jgi:hypothetical protein
LVIQTRTIITSGERNSHMKFISMCKTPLKLMCGVT